MPCRKYGAETAYTPMLHSFNFSGNEKHRNQEFNTCPVDCHCLSKFCASGPEILLEAAQRAEPFCFRSGHDQEGRRTKEEEEKNLESSVYTKRCVEREIACVEGEFRELGRLAFIFLSRVEDSWLIFVLLEVCGLNNGLDPAAWTTCIGKQYWASNNWRLNFCSQRDDSNQLLKWRLAGLLLSILEFCGSRCATNAWQDGFLTRVILHVMDSNVGACAILRSTILQSRELYLLDTIKLVIGPEGKNDGNKVILKLPGSLLKRLGFCSACTLWARCF